MAEPELILYYRVGCHLCEEMLQALRGLQLRLGFDLQLVDVDRDPGLVDRYGEWLPVLCLEDRVICCHHLEDQKLLQVLDRLRP